MRDTASTEPALDAAARDIAAGIIAAAIAGYGQGARALDAAERVIAATARIGYRRTSRVPCGPACTRTGPGTG